MQSDSVVITAHCGLKKQRAVQSRLQVNDDRALKGAEQDSFHYREL